MPEITPSPREELGRNMLLPLNARNPMLNSEPHQTSNPLCISEPNRKDNQ
jgi:hypothetical protein